MSGLRKLGQNYARYGVKAHHFPVVKEAMLYSICTVLEEDESSPALVAWSIVLDLIIDAMQNWDAL